MADVKVRQSKAFHPVIHRQDQAETLDKNIPFPWRSGKLIENLEIVPGQQLRVDHGLGRKHKGWVLVRPRNTSGFSLYEIQPSSVNRTKTMMLSATGAGTFDLWVW